MAVLNLNGAIQSADSTNDSIVIIKSWADIAGGVVLDTTGWSDDTIYAGHGVIVETATGVYKPLPVTGVITASHTAVGVVKASVLASKPAVGVVVGGQVNEEAMEYPVSAAFKAATPNIIYTQD